MAPPHAQTYATHRHQPVAWSLTWLAALLVTIVMAVIAYRRPSYERVAVVVLGVVVLMAVSLLRTFALRLQNRIIRLEMQVRLTALGRAEALRHLDLPQLIALRFASDAEILGLVDRAIVEKMTADQIKRAVTNWQGDYLRT